MANIEKSMKDYENLKLAIAKLKEPNVVSVDLTRFGLNHRNEFVHDFILENKKYELVGNRLQKYSRESSLRSTIVMHEENVKMYEKKIEFLKIQIAQEHEKMNVAIEELNNPNHDTNV